MSMFSKENCIICNNEVGALLRTKLNNGEVICANCTNKTKLTNIWNVNTLKSSTREEIQDRINYIEDLQNENKEKIEKFTPTYKEGGYIWFDDVNKWFVIPKGTFSSKIDDSVVFRYDEIIDFEVLEDGNTITKGGFGKAIIGGAIFGIAGAIAGGTSKRSKEICTKLEIKITTKNPDNPVVYITLISSKFKKDGVIYKTAAKSVQNILSKFQIILNELEEKNDSNNKVISSADEIKKYKELLDIGAITENEFNEKKKQLLDL